MCLEVFPGLVSGRFVILFSECVGEDACFCDYYFSNADQLLIFFRISVGFYHSRVGVDEVEDVVDRIVVEALMIGCFDVLAM